MLNPLSKDFIDHNKAKKNLKNGKMNCTLHQKIV